MEGNTASKPVLLTCDSDPNDVFLELKALRAQPAESDPRFQDSENALVSFFDDSGSESDSESDGNESDTLEADVTSNDPQSNGTADAEVRNKNTESGRLLIEMKKRGKKSPDTQEERKELVAKEHLIGHFGREAIFRKLWNKGYWWHKIREDINDELKSCDACIRFTVVKTGYHPPKSITANGPGDHFQIDLASNLPETKSGHVALLVLIDVFTGFVILRALRDKTAETVARKLYKIFCLIGFPKILQSDNAREFVNDVLRALIRLAGIDHRLISPYNPRADGKVERAVGSVTMIIKKLLHGVDTNWHLFVPFAQFAFNYKISHLTGSSPFALMFGRDMNVPADYSDVDVDNTISLSDWKLHQEKIMSLIYPAISTRIRGVKDEMMKRLYHTRRQLMPNAIPTGASVMLVDPIRNNKFEPKYLGPYIVVRRAQNGGYVLKDATGDILDRHVPVDQLKLIDRSGRFVDSNVFAVRKIVDHRGSPGNYEFLVDWKGYKEQTWEPERNILDYDCVKDYWSRRN
jgi:hypothetical protein